MMPEHNNMVALENAEPRPDVRLKVTGAAKYTADIALPKMIYAKFIRFPYGVGTVGKADVDAAKKVQGVLEVEFDAGKASRYPGDRLGHIAAETPRAIEDAIAAMKIEFRMQPPRTDPQALMGAVPEPDGNDKTKLESIFKNAAAVVEATYTTEVQTHSCLETHGGVIDVKGDSVEAWGSTQGTFAYHGGLSGPTGVPGSKITVHCEFVGGGFGSKFGPDAEGDLAARLSKKYGRPCKAMLDRKEEHLDAGNRPGSIQYVKVGVAKDGKILGGRFHIASVVGFEPGNGGCRNPSLYNFGDTVVTNQDISISSGLPRAFRAPGWPQGVFGSDSLMDELAAGIGMDPVKFRQLNEQSERRKRQLTIGAGIIGWDQRQADGASPGRVKRGLGCAGSTWFDRPRKNTGADVDIFNSGEVEVRCGVQDIGTGCSTVLLDVCAYHLQIDRSLITSKLGNSSYPEGPASGGSVTSTSVAPAVRDAAENALTELKKILAREWDSGGPDKIRYEQGVFQDEAGGRNADWKTACALVTTKVSARGQWNERYAGSGSSDGVQFAEVEVDTETGIVRVKKIVAVQACGQAVNRLTTENQICGGVIQGVSFALFENRWLDRNTGAMLNPNLEFYKIAGSMDIPEIIPIIDWIDGDTGVRSLGEPTTIPTSAAIANAVANAIGVRVRSLPITPQRVLAALEMKKI